MWFGAARAEPLLTQGIGTSNCARLAGDLKAAEGLANPVNLMAYSRAQGYISAANIALAEDRAPSTSTWARLDEKKILEAPGQLLQSQSRQAAARRAQRISAQEQQGPHQMGQGHGRLDSVSRRGAEFVSEPASNT